MQLPQDRHQPEFALFPTLAKHLQQTIFLDPYRPPPLRIPMMMVAGSYGPETCRIASSLGYRIGFNFIAGVNRLPGKRPLDLNRFAVEENAAPARLKATVACPWL